MNLNQLTFRNLFYHAAANLAVLLGVAVGTAVLTGALLIGDSLRYSLTRLTEERLGWVDQALVGGRFLPQSLADGLTAPGVAPILMLRGSAISVNDRDRINRKVQILGVDARFWNNGQAGANDPDAGKVTINEALANDLHLQVGQSVDVSLLKASDVPRESLLGDRDPDAGVGTTTFAVERILSDDDFGAKFSLQPSLETVGTIFVPLAKLQEALQQAGKINGLLLRGADGATVSSEIQARLTLADLGLKIVTPEDRAARLMSRLDRNRDGILTGTEWFRRVGEKIVPRFAAAIANAIERPTPETIGKSDLEAYYRKHPYISVESKALLIEPALQEAALAAAKDAGLTATPTLVYLANTLAVGSKDLPYVLVAGVDPALPPLGPTLVPGGIPDDHILLVKWPGSPFSDKPGAKVKLTYYPPEQHGDYQEEPADLTSVGAVDLKGALIDPDLTPEFPGVTDKDDISSWKPPFKFDSSRVKPGDVSERFWEQYRTTPRAYLNLATATRLFGSRFGNATSIRLFVPPGIDEKKALKTFQERLRAGLTLDKLGLVVRSVKADGLEASSGAMNFAGLFLGFSFFLIAAALLLVGLLFRLNLERRAKEIGVLATSGYRSSVLRGLLLREGTLLAVIGAILGTLLALVYSRLLIQWMEILWPEGMLNSFLRPSWTWLSLVIGFAGAILVALGTIWWVVRGMAKVPPRLLIAGKTKDETDPTSLSRGPGRWQWYVTIGCLVVGVALLGVAFYVPDHDTQASTFFGSGALFLTAGMFLVSLWLRSTSPTPLRPRGGLTQLGIRNLARNPGRSLLTVGLLASAAFLLVAVESFRRSADNSGHDRDSPDGGFLLVGESELPIVQDPNSPDGRAALLDALQTAWQDRKEKNIPTLRAEASTLLHGVTIVGLRMRDGDDASCLNLYQPRKPRVLGVPDSLLRRRRFVLGGSEAKTPEEVKNPWLLLAGTPDGKANGVAPIPAFGESNTVQWMLGSSLGGTVEVKDATGTPVALHIAGLLQDSVFQSSLLIGEPAFLKLYPDQEGYRFFLIACRVGTEDRVKDLLQTAFAKRGLSVETSAKRLNAYLGIENTYLTTFQALGGLGLILGSLGLAIVLLRSVWERRGELALLQALGYRHSSLLLLILIENAMLLVLGLVVGTVSALLSIAPQLVAHTASLPWRNLTILLGAVALVGFTATLLATWAALRTPLPPALRRE